MEEAAQVPVEERLHIEALRLLMENAKLRKTLNDYSEGILHNTLAKVEGSRYASCEIRALSRSKTICGCYSVCRL